MSFTHFLNVILFFMLLSVFISVPAVLVSRARSTSKARPRMHFKLTVHLVLAVGSWVLISIVGFALLFSAAYSISVHNYSHSVEFGVLKIIFALLVLYSLFAASVIVSQSLIMGSRRNRLLFA